MKVTLAVLGLVLFAVLAECKPAENLLRERTLEKLAERGVKNDGDSEAKKDGGDWPYGWMEFAALYAKCASGVIMMEQWGEYINAALESVGVDGANLMADKESLSLTIPLSGGKVEDSEFLQEADVLFEVCNKVFEHVQAKLREEEDEAVDAAEDTDDKRVIKTLLNHFRK